MRGNGGFDVRYRGPPAECSGDYVSDWGPLLKRRNLHPDRVDSA